LGRGYQASTSASISLNPRDFTITWPTSFPLACDSLVSAARSTLVSQPVTTAKHIHEIGTPTNSQFFKDMSFQSFCLRCALVLRSFIQTRTNPTASNTTTPPITASCHSISLKVCQERSGYPPSVLKRNPARSNNSDITIRPRRATSHKAESPVASDRTFLLLHALDRTNRCANDVIDPVDQKHACRSTANALLRSFLRNSLQYGCRSEFMRIDCDTPNAIANYLLGGASRSTNHPISDRAAVCGELLYLNCRGEQLPRAVSRIVAGGTLSQASNISFVGSEACGIKVQNRFL
jgi:hypothetical protein